MVPIAPSHKSGPCRKRSSTGSRMMCPSFWRLGVIETKQGGDTTLGFLLPIIANTPGRSVISVSPGGHTTWPSCDNYAGGECAGEQMERRTHGGGKITGAGRVATQSVRGTADRRACAAV